MIKLILVKNVLNVLNRVVYTVVHTAHKILLFELQCFTVAFICCGQSRTNLSTYCFDCLKCYLLQFCYMICYCCNFNVTANIPLVVNLHLYSSWYTIDYKEQSTMLGGLLCIHCCQIYVNIILFNSLVTVMYINS